MTPSIAIVGAGFGGLAVALELKAAGIDSFTVLERAQEVGGVWQANTYPGAACDVPSVIYQFSRHLKPDWSRRFGSQQEIRNYRDVANVHELPDIFHYWSNKYLRPKAVQLGFDHPDEFFALHLQEAGVREGPKPPRFVSIGAGNCDTEVRVAKRLRDRGTLALKRSLAQREFALGVESLNRFVSREPLYRIHECVFGVLALESEPVDPAL